MKECWGMEVHLHTFLMSAAVHLTDQPLALVTLSSRKENPVGIKYTFVMNVKGQ